METEQGQTIRIRDPEARPTPRQVYALARQLARHADVEFPRHPARCGAASELIERLRKEAAER